jgi:hypothetical protein
VNAQNCQGYNVSNFVPVHVPFGTIVSADAHNGSLVGFVHQAANCGVN